VSRAIRRVSHHRLGVVEGFTRDYGVRTLVFAEFHETMEGAILREKPALGPRSRGDDGNFCHEPMNETALVKRVSAEPNTKHLWIYDLRTNQRFTLKERPMTRADLDGFVACYRSGRRHERAETERFRRYAYAELAARDKINLDISWLKDDTLDDPDLLPPPDEIAAEIVENLEAALDRFRKVALSLQA